jgi:hypothetical protein
MSHPVNRQVIEGDYVKQIDHATAALMGEVAAPPACAFMRPRHHPSASGAFWRFLFFLAEAALRLGKRVFITPIPFGPV